MQELADSGGVGISVVGMGNIKPASAGLRIVCSGYSTNSGQGLQHPDSTHFIVMVSGSTYPHKDVLKGFGLRWDAAQKVWRGTVDRDQLKQVESFRDVQLCVIPRKETEAATTTPTEPHVPEQVSPSLVKPEPANQPIPDKNDCEAHNWLCQNCDLEKYRDAQYALGYISTTEAAEKLLLTDGYMFRLDSARRTDQLHASIHVLLNNGYTADRIKAIIGKGQRDSWTYLAKSWVDGLEHSRRCVFGDFPYDRNESDIRGHESDAANTMKITDNVRTWAGHAKDEYDMLVELHKRIGRFAPGEPEWLKVLEMRMKGEALDALIDK